MLSPTFHLFIFFSFATVQSGMKEEGGREEGGREDMRAHSKRAKKTSDKRKRWCRECVAVCVVVCCSVCCSVLQCVLQCVLQSVLQCVETCLRIAKGRRKSLIRDSKRWCREPVSFRTATRIKVSIQSKKCTCYKYG